LTTWLLFLLLGLGAGAVYAGIAMGLILVHRGSGVVNFAHGAMAMFPAMTFVELRRTGDLVLPLLGPPSRISTGGGAPFVVALLLALAVAAAIGAVAYLAVFRPLGDATPLTRLVASVGVTIILQGLAVLHFGPGTRRSAPILPDGVVEILGRPVPQDRLWLAGAVVVVGAGLAALYRHSRFGLRTRAAASSPKGAVLIGVSPQHLGLVNWVLASSLAGLFGILVSPISGVNPFNYSFFVVPALAAALAARLQRFDVAIAAGLGIGMFEALSVHLVARRQIPTFLHGGFSTVLPFLVIVGALVLLGRDLPGRGVRPQDHHPWSPLPNLTPAVVLPTVAGLAGVLAWAPPALRLATIESLLMAVLMLSIVVLTGYVGQVSLAQLSFAGFSAFMLARFAGGWGVPFPLSPALAVVVTTAFGTVLGIPALRIRGVQFAIVTLAAAVAIEQLLFRSPTFTGPGGVAHVDPPAIAGFDLGIIGAGEYPDRRFGFLTLGVTLACILLVANVRRSHTGRRFLAIRSNERAAAAAGVDIARTKLLAAALSSFVAAVSGVLLAYKNVDLSSAGLEASRGLQLLALAYLGGVGSIAGAMVAGMLVPSGVVSELLGQSSSVGQLLVSGVGLVVVTRWFPGGIASAGHRVGSLLAGRPHGTTSAGGAARAPTISVHRVEPLGEWSPPPPVAVRARSGPAADEIGDGPG